MPEAGHVVDFKKAKVQAQAKTKRSRLVNEACLSGPNALNRSIELHLSFLTLRYKLQQEDKRWIDPRNNSNTENQQTEQLDQVGEFHNEEPMLQGPKRRSRARIIAARQPRTKNMDKHKQ